MADLTIGTAVQPIYPFGEQDSFVITNKGPWTVYVDNDASVSSASHPIPPTGVMVWDANRPLFMVAAGDSSTVIITRNAQPSQFTNSLYSLLYQETAVDVGSGGAGFSDQLECTAFQSLTLIINSETFFIASGGTPGKYPSGKYYNVTFQWFDEDGNVLSVENVQTLAQSKQVVIGGTESVRITIPVKGARVRFAISLPFTASGTPVLCDLKLLATTRVLPLRAVFCGADCQPHFGNAGGFGFANQYGTDSYFTDTWPTVANTWANIYLPQISNRLKMTFVVSTVGTAGALSVRHPNPDIVTVADSGTIAIPVAGGLQIVTATIDIDVSSPLVIIPAVTPKNAGIACDASIKLDWL